MAAARQLSPNEAGYPAVMRREDWAARMTDVVAGEVRRYRQERGLTAQQLVDACNELGLPMRRSVLVNLEHGRRGNVTLAELLALAYVLGVSPTQLAFPLGRERVVEVLPDRPVETWAAVGWFTGEAPFPVVQRSYESSSGVLVEPSLPTSEVDAWETKTRTMLLFRRHADLCSDFYRAQNAANQERRAAAKAGSDTERAALLRAAAAEERRGEQVMDSLRDLHRQMVDAQLIPPPLPVVMRLVVDTEEADR